MAKKIPTINKQISSLRKTIKKIEKSDVNPGIVKNYNNQLKKLLIRKDIKRDELTNFCRLARAKDRRACARRNKPKQVCLFGNRKVCTKEENDTFLKRMLK